MKKLLILLFVFLYLEGSNNLYKRGELVIDKQNNLIWQDTKDNIMLRMTQEKAIEHCEKLSFSGLSNWRLPSVEEYKTIIDKTRDDENMIKKIFHYNLPVNYWASDRTWIRNFGRYGYYIFFKSGTAYYQNRTYLKFVRCVHSL
jgi:hypothetical protein